MTADQEKLKAMLDERVEFYNRPAFVAADPICIPHQYTSRQDIEITAFWTAMLAWGQRVTIINKARELFAMMGPSPYAFIMQHSDIDRKPLLTFRHRTFQPTDTLFFLEFFRDYYRKNDSLERAFHPDPARPFDTKAALLRFHQLMFDHAWAPQRTRKHVSTPAKGASCKRLNMFLRWMVRRDHCGVDFGIWRTISPGALMIPLDVHVHRVATRLGLLHRKTADWQGVVQLTERLRQFDPNDPVKYDFALFSMGVLEKDL